MNPYVSLRDDLYLVLATLFPNTEIVQAYTNGMEAQTPYLTYDIMRMDTVGDVSVSGVGLDNIQQIVQHYEAQVRLEFIGKQDDNFEAAALAADFEFSLGFPVTQDLLQKNALSYMRRSATRRLPKKRENDWYMCHSIDIFFGYQVVARHNVNETIETVIISDKSFTTKTN